MKEPIWVQAPLVKLTHKMLIKEHGGLNGLRDEDSLESALARPRHLYLYEKPSIFDLAASYANGIAKNHPFLDGNKRTAFITTYIFLERNQVGVQLPEAEAVILMNQIAAGEIEEKVLAQYLSRFCRPKEDLP